MSLTAAISAGRGEGGFFVCVYRELGFESNRSGVMLMAIAIAIARGEPYL